MCSKKSLLVLLIACAHVFHANAGTDSFPTDGDVNAMIPKAMLRREGGQMSRVGLFANTPPLSQSMHLYANREYKPRAPIPDLLEGKLYYESEIDKACRFKCLKAGEAFVLAPVNMRRDVTAKLGLLGFLRVAGMKEFQFFGENPADVFAVFRKTLAAGETFELPPAAIVAGFEPVREKKSGELLYNGIRLPDEWPPRGGWENTSPMEVPYLVAPPKLIPIDVGRQLFVDDFLIESSDLEREYHHPEKYAGNPVLKPETDLEKNGLNHLAIAAPKSGGLWWNPEKQLFELWYEAGWVTTVAYATSKDGIHWKRPGLSVTPGTNQVLPSEIKPDSWTIVRDYRTTDPKQKFKIFLRGSGNRERARGFLSENGLDWGQPFEGGLCGDRSTMFYNPFRKKWIYSLRWTHPLAGRSRTYWEADDFVQGMQWLPDEPVLWARADELDPPDPRIGDTPQLYNLDAVPYESLMLGFFEILHGPSNDINAAKGLPKNTGLNFAYSRDGFHWSRPDRRMAIDSEQRAVWDRGYVQPLGNICTVRGDKLWFYYIGFAGDPNKKSGDPGVTDSMRSGLYGNGATGIAILRRDGFVSLNAGSTTGVLVTKPVTFSGKYLFVNVDAPRGGLSAEVVDMDGHAIDPFTFENSIPFTGDSTIARMEWKGGGNLSKLANGVVRFRFKVKTAKFYSFWVSRDESGRSDGYVAGGGPGFTCDIDTVGKLSLDAENQLMSARPKGEQAKGRTQ